MVKGKRKSNTAQIKSKSFLSKFNIDELIPSKNHIWIVILLLIILFLIFLNPLYFGNKSFQSGDIISSQAMQPYVANHTEGYTLWDPLIFCGMPAYAIGVSFKWFNMIAVIVASVRDVFTCLFSVEYTMWTFYLIILSITSFLFMRYLTKNVLVSLFTAIATSFSTGIIVFLYIGHVTKLNSLCMYPLIFLMLLKFKEKIKLIDFLILIIALQILLLGFHVQIIYYTLLSIGIYFLYFFLRSIFKEDSTLRISILKSAGMFAIALLIAFLIQSDNFTQIYEYSQFSTRGTESIVDKVSGKQQQNTSEYYNYHTNWSFSPGEVLTFIVPSYYGFGNSTYKGPLTNQQPVDVNTYFGQMPFVDVAMYMGVLVFFFALFGIFTRWKEPLVQFLTILSILALFISFGKTFPFIFDLLFKFLPFFNKFRVPSMILVLVQMSFPILAGLGLMKIISLKNEEDIKLENLIRNVAFVFTGIFIIGVLLNGSITQWFTLRVNDYAAELSASRPQLAKQFQVLADYSASMFLSDFLFCFAFLSIAFWAANFYIKGKVSRDSLVVIVIALSLIDLWRIDARGARYIEAPALKNMFEKTEYVSMIQERNDKEPFRILNLKQDGSLGSFNQNSNYNAYFLLEDFYGYSGIKPRAYQDIIDVVGPVNSTLWRMLNVKYIVTDKPAQFPGLNLIYNDGKTIVYLNQNELPRLYFVDSVEYKPEMEILEQIKFSTFNPELKAYVAKENLKVEPAGSTTNVNITKYQDELVTADVKASGNNFLFFGNTYMAGKVDYKFFKLPTGWKAYIDNKETEIYKTNHGYMGIVVPKGKHKIEFIFAPLSFYISKYIVLFLSSFVVLALMITIVLGTKKL